MLKICHGNDPALLYLPPRVVPTIKKLLDTSGPDPSADQGFVVFIEHGDELSALSKVLCRDLGQSLEGVFHADDYIVGVVIWGNSGDGVSIVCPNVDGYTDEIMTILKRHLSEEEGL